MATYTELLSKIDSAIIDILDNGQNVTVGGVIYTKANIESLFKYQEKIKKLSSAEKSSVLNRRITGIPHRP